MMLNRVFLTVMADNISGIKVYEKAGFLCEGVLREDYLRGNTYVDVLVMGVTKKMWLKFGNISQIGGVLLPNQIAICATLPDSNARRTVA
jgi:hypothetical protein